MCNEQSHGLSLHWPKKAESTVPKYADSLYTKTLAAEHGLTKVASNYHFLQHREIIAVKTDKTRPS